MSPQNLPAGVSRPVSVPPVVSRNEECSEPEIEAGLHAPCAGTAASDYSEAA